MSKLRYSGMIVYFVFAVAFGLWQTAHGNSWPAQTWACIGMWLFLGVAGLTSRILKGK